MKNNKKTATTELFDGLMDLGDLITKLRQIIIDFRDSMKLLD